MTRPAKDEHYCAKCCEPAVEGELVWDDDEDDFVCQDCRNRTEPELELGSPGGMTEDDDDDEQDTNDGDDWKDEYGDGSEYL
jgi:hypothetical protein